MLPRRIPLISIGYKYNARKVLYFIVIEKSWNTQADTPNLFKYPDQFTNVSICLVAQPLDMYKLFGLVNEVDPPPNQVSLIWGWRSSGLLSVVGYSYLRQLLW